MSERLPHHIQSRIDALLADFDGTTPLPDHPDVVAVFKWCESNPDAVGLFDYEHLMLRGIHVMDAAGRLDFSDTELRVYMGLDDDEPITPSMRIEYMVDRLTSYFEDASDGDPVFSVVPIHSSSDGKAAVLGYSVSGGGWGIVEVEWYGVFGGVPEFERWLGESGWITSVEAFSAWPPERQLQLWQTSAEGRHPKHRRKPKV